MSYAYDEATLDLLRLTIPTYGILVPIIQRSGTNEVIDGRHRLKIRDEMAEQGIKIMLPVHHVDTENPAEIDQIVNSVRRPWQDTEQRRKLVAQLRDKGHSHQRIADAVGTHKKTVQNDLKTETATGGKAPGGEKAPPGAKPALAKHRHDAGHGCTFHPRACPGRRIKSRPAVIYLTPQVKESDHGDSLGYARRTLQAGPAPASLERCLQ